VSAGEGWVEFDRRLGPEWADLATALEIPTHVQRRFRPGHEAAAIRDWQDRKGALDALADGLVAIDRADLVPLVREAIAARPAVEVSEPLRVDPTTEFLVPRRRPHTVPAAVAGCLLLLVAAVVITVLVRSDPSDGEPPRTGSSASAGPGLGASDVSSDAPRDFGVAPPPVQNGAGGTGTPRASAALRATRTSYTGPCPPPADAIRFTARLDLGGATGLARYRWVRSDGVTSETFSVNVDTAAAKPEVSTTWLPGADFNGSLRLELLAPAAALSNPVAFGVTCQIAIAANLAVSPKSSGDCAAIFTLSGEIEVSDGPIDVTYVFVTTSNPQGETVTIPFRGRGRQTQTLSTVVQPLRSGTFSAHVEIRSPRHVESNAVAYAVDGTTC